MTLIYGTAAQEAWSFEPGYEQYTLRMGAGADAVIDRSLSDSIIFGGAGDDILQTYAGNDRLHGGKGDDSFFVSNTGNAHRVELWGGKGHDSALLESDTAAAFHTKLDNGDVVIGYLNGTVVTLHGMEDVLLINHGDVPPWN